MSDQPEDDPHAAPAPAPQPEREPTALERLVSHVPSWVWTVMVFAAGLYALVGPLGGLAGKLGMELRERQRERETLAPMLEQAQRRRATYEDAQPGDLVHWCVDHISPGNTYLAGRPSEPLRWLNEPVVPLTYGPTSGGRCRGMLARVVERRPDGALVLEYLGQP